MRSVSAWIALIVLCCLAKWVMWIVIDVGIDPRPIDKRKTLIVTTGPVQPSPISDWQFAHYKTGITVVVIVNIVDGLFVVALCVLFLGLTRVLRLSRVMLLVLACQLLVFFYDIVIVAIERKWMLADGWVSVGYMIAIVIQILLSLYSTVCVTRGGAMKAPVDLLVYGLVYYYGVSRIVLLALH